MLLIHEAQTVHEVQEKHGKEDGPACLSHSVLKEVGVEANFVWKSVVFTLQPDEEVDSAVVFLTNNLIHSVDLFSFSRFRPVVEERAHKIFVSRLESVRHSRAYRCSSAVIVVVGVH